MAQKIIMPKQGLQMTEGTIMKWLAKEGDKVEAGKPLFEIETDKLTITIDSTATGTLLKIISPEGAVVPITETIAVVGEAGEDISAFVGGASVAPAAAAPAAQPAPAAPAAPAASAPAVQTNAQKIIMPKQGLQMTEGTIIKWLAKEGDKVETGKPLFEMETDKLTITIDSTATGTLLKIVSPEGSVVPITETIAIVGDPGDDITPLLPTGAAAVAAVAAPAVSEAPSAKPESAPTATATVARADGERVFATPRAKLTADKNGVDYTTLAGSGPDGLIIEKDVLNAPKIQATPVAKAMAAAAGIKLSEVKGSGANGKIMKCDVTAAMNIPAEVMACEETIVPIAGMRKAISNNMMNSLHNMAQAHHRIQVDMTQAALIRTAFKSAEKSVSYNDILIMALSRALLEHPDMNSLVMGNEIHQKHYVNMGIAVAVPNGLVVPTVRGTEKMTLDEIHAEATKMIKGAQAGKLSGNDYRDATFTITNLGMFDIDEFVAIINPPQVGILAVGKINDTPVVVNGAVAIRPMMTLTLTYDHRIIDGAPAAKFLQRLKALLENPYIMLT